MTTDGGTEPGGMATRTPASGGGRDIQAARAVKDQLRAQLAGDQRFRGVGLTARDDEPGSFAVVVRVVAVSTAAELGLPEAVAGVPVWVVAAGDVTVRPPGSETPDEPGC